MAIYLETYLVEYFNHERNDLFEKWRIDIWKMITGNHQFVMIAK